MVPLSPPAGAAASVAALKMFVISPNRMVPAATVYVPLASVTRRSSAPPVPAAAPNNVHVFAAVHP